MSSAEDVQAWFDAVQLYDNDNIEEAIQKFQEVTSNSKMLFDVGCCYLRINDITAASQNYQSAVDSDKHMAIGFFMLGLTCYLQKNYEESMKNFEKSLNLLRGNRFVDYRQLGLKYQLYSCEILTNQAVIAYNQKKLGKAKGLLLQAVGCKAEKRHESIVDLLTSLQSGYPISPFIPPQSEIFRPPKAAVDNLKKKNYLGKSKVISTENTDEIYACFSGLREEQAKQMRKQPKPQNRNNLLTDLRMPERKKTLRPTPRPPKKQLPELKLGHVVDAPRKSLPSAPLPFSAPPRGSSLPPAPNQTLPKMTSLPPKTALSQPSIDVNNNENNIKSKTFPNKPARAPPNFPLPRKPIPKLPEEQESYEPVQSSAMEEYNAIGYNGNLEEYNALEYYNDGESEDEYEEIDEDELKQRRPPPVPTTNRPRLPTNPVPNRRPDKGLPPTRKKSEEILSLSDRKMSNPNVSKPGRAPPPPPTETRKSSKEEIQNERRRSEDIVIPPRKFFPLRRLSEPSVNEFVRGNKFISKPPTNGKMFQLPPTPVTREKKKSVGNDIVPEEEGEVFDRCYQEFEIQYTFIRKVRVPQDASLHQFKKIAAAEKIPDKIELCYNDDLGRQQTLTESNFNDVLQKNQKKLFCFPSS